MPNASFFPRVTQAHLLVYNRFAQTGQQKTASVFWPFFCLT